MRRRKFITLLGGAAAAWPLSIAAFGQALNKRPWRIGFLAGSSYVEATRNTVGFLEGMRGHGYIDGIDFEMEYRWAEGHLGRMSVLAEDLVRSRPDLIVAAIVQAAVAARDATTTIPIVCPLLVDPVQLSLIKNDARPAGNVTGLLEVVEGLPAKQLELVLDVIPAASKIGLAVNPENINNLPQRRELETAAAAKSIKLVPIEARKPEDVDLIFPTLASERVHAVIVLRDPMFYRERRRMAASAIAVRLPTIYGIREHVDDGGLISYGINLPDNFRRAADYVIKILKGAKPGDLPVEFPTRLELVINLRTAKALGLEIPPTLLARADEVIE
jgi:putative ABC transport system substrate-binding protein